MSNSNQLQLLRDQYQQLHDMLSHAREACAKTDLRDSLRQQEEAVDALITAMNQADIESRTGDFEGLIEMVGSVNTDLGKLRDDIAKTGENIAVLGKVVSGINSVISIAAKLLA
jgi:hypothetical protein